MNPAGACRVLARVSALPVSYRKHGSANGNRTCLTLVQYGPIRSNSFILRSVGTAAMAQSAPQVLDVAARWQRTLPELATESPRLRGQPGSDALSLPGFFRSLLRHPNFRLEPIRKAPSTKRLLNSFSESESECSARTLPAYNGPG